MHLRWRLSHVRGYLELGLIDEAAAELAHVPPAEAETLPVLALRLAVLQEQERWPELVIVAGQLVRQQPAEAGWWIAYAYGARRAHSLVEAEAILREAERHHPADPTIQFNLGCYACQSADYIGAARRVQRAIELDPKFRALAATDPDLAPLRAPGGPFA